MAGEDLEKGRHVYEEGGWETSKRTDKDGVEKYTTEIMADNMQLLGGREGGGGDEGGGGGGGYSRGAQGGGGGGERQERSAPAARPAASKPAPSKSSTGF